MWNAAKWRRPVWNAAKPVWNAAKPAWIPAMHVWSAAMPEWNAAKCGLCGMQQSCVECSKVKTGQRRRQDRERQGLGPMKKIKTELLRATLPSAPNRSKFKPVAWPNKPVIKASKSFAPV